MKKAFVWIISIVLLNSCTLFEQKRYSGALVECRGQIITHAEIEQLTAGLSTEDSARVAERYIHQWAIDILTYDRAKDKPNKAIEHLVEDYRRSLYIHEYEQRLIAQRMPHEVEDTLVKAFYETHNSHFILRETILQGVLLVIPNEAPNMELLRKKIQNPFDEENIEWIEKFAYQYATGYELFTEDWKTINQILLRMPFQTDDLDKQLKHKQQIELQDSTNTYLLQITAMHQSGQKMPLDYARPEIKKIILSQRQVEFLHNEQEALYNKAIKEGQLKRYEE